MTNICKYANGKIWSGFLKTSLFVGKCIVSFGKSKYFFNNFCYFRLIKRQFLESRRFLYEHFIEKSIEKQTDSSKLPCYVQYFLFFQFWCWLKYHRLPGNVFLTLRCVAAAEHRSGAEKGYPGFSPSGTYVAISTACPEYIS